MIAKARSILEGRFRISAQMYLGIGGAVVLTLSASLVAWLSFDQIGDATNRVKEESVPEMVRFIRCRTVHGSACCRRTATDGCRNERRV